MEGVGGILKAHPASVRAPEGLVLAQLPNPAPIRDALATKRSRSRLRVAASSAEADIIWLGFVIPELYPAGLTPRARLGGCRKLD